MLKVKYRNTCELVSDDRIDLRVVPERKIVMHQLLKEDSNDRSSGKRGEEIVVVINMRSRIRIVSLNLLT